MKHQLTSLLLWHHRLFETGKLADKAPVFLRSFARFDRNVSIMPMTKHRQARLARVMTRPVST